MICMVVRAANVVTIEYKGATATVTIPDELAAYVTCTSGTSSHVKLVQSDDVADGAPGEITYQLSGSSDDGGFEMSGKYKCTVKLAGLTLTNPEGAAINIDDGKRVELNASKETTNTLADGADGNWKACIYAKGHFELKGKGTINVVGNTAHAISCKEYMQVKNLTLNVTAAAKDGLHCQQYFWMQSGTINISGAKANGIKVELDGKTPTEVYPEHENGDEDEDTGNCYLDDGKLTISNCDGSDIIWHIIESTLCKNSFFIFCRTLTIGEIISVLPVLCNCSFSTIGSCYIPSCNDIFGIVSTIFFCP